MSDGRVLLLASDDCRLDVYAATVKRLSDLKIVALMPGHGAFLCQWGQRGTGTGQCAVRPACASAQPSLIRAMTRAC